MRTAAPTTRVVDLVQVADACAAIVGWYDRLRGGADPTVVELDAAVARLAVLPPLGGGLGRAIRVLATGGAPDPADTLRALEALRHAGRLARPGRPRTTRRQRHGTVYDTPLPGIDDDPDGRAGRRP